MRLGPETTICDPACGTGGFLLAAYDYVQNHYQLDRDQKRFQREDALRGVDIVGGVVRLCAMNLYLRGIGGEESPVVADDSLRSLGSTRYDVVHHPALRQEELIHRPRSGRQGRQREPDLRVRRLLGHHIEQAAQLSLTRKEPAEDRRHGGGRPRQRALRGWGG